MKIPNKIMIITPIFFGSGSGAAKYYKLLSQELISQNNSVFIVSDQELPISKDDKCLKEKITFFPLFPIRALRNKQKYYDLYKYAIQNIKYLLLPLLIRQAKPEVLIIHSGFLNHLTLFGFIIKIIRKVFPYIKLVVDVRDRGLKKKYISILNIADRIVACSVNVELYIKSLGGDEHKVFSIPVIQGDVKVDEKKCFTTLKKYKLKKNSYIFYAGLLKKKKRVDEILSAYVNFLNKNHQYSFKLVLAGLLKEQDKKFLNLLTSNNVCYLGNLDSNDVYCLMKNAKLNLNISKNEGMPRTSLEALTLGGSVILPPNIPEFTEYCDEFIYKGNSSEELATFINKTLINEKKNNYPIEHHSKSKVINLYNKLLSDLVK